MKLLIKRIYINFNPRPREEGDNLVDKYSIYFDISIHALVKRATEKEETDNDYQNISIHALVKRATLSSYRQFLSQTFQSTPS